MNAARAELEHLGAASPAARERWFANAAPWVFVLLWSTGFIGTRYVVRYAEPFTFLALRMAIACVALGAIARWRRADWPRDRTMIGRIAVSGLLLHAAYLGGVLVAIDRGMPAGLAALMVGLQPILTAILAQSLLRERVNARQWLGLALGFVGVGLVVEEKVTTALDHPIAHSAFVAITIALFGTTFGALYQKRFVRTVDLTATASIQYGAAFVLAAVASALFEDQRIDWTPQFVFGLVWLLVVLSVGAILLLLWLIRQHSLSRVSSLLYLVPPVTALQAYLLFDETLGRLAIAGMALVAAGVFLVIRSPAPAPKASLDLRGAGDAA